MCSLSIASINSFSNTAVNILSKGLSKTDPRPRIPLTIQGTTVDALFDTGAQINCLTRATYDKFFAHLHRVGRNGRNGAILGAGSNNLHISAIHKWSVTCNGRTELQEFWICDTLNENIVGIPFMNIFGLRYDAEAQRVMNINDMAPKSLSLAADLHIEPH